MTAVWKIAPGEDAVAWPECRDFGCILVGWNYLGSYRKFRSTAAIEEALDKSPGHRSGAARSIWQFTHQVQIGDVIIANIGRSGVAGIGVVQSEYLPPNHPKTPIRHSLFPNSRLVEWHITTPIQLSKFFFNIPTVQLLRLSQVREIRDAYLNTNPKLKGTLSRIFEALLSSEVDNSAISASLQSLSKVLGNERGFDPTDAEDGRDKVLASIVRRRGQPEFRRKLLQLYKGRCAISGCDIEAVLEAAHIYPYKGTKTNTASNGILLRADLHTLFDLKLISIDKNLRLLVSEKLNGSIYEIYRGKRLRLPEKSSHRPSEASLSYHRDLSQLGN